MKNIKGFLKDNGMKIASGIAVAAFGMVLYSMNVAELTKQIADDELEGQEKLDQ